MPIQRFSIIDETHSRQNTMRISMIVISLAIVLSTCHANFQEVTGIHLLRPSSSFHGVRLTGINCLSWRLAVEANNLRDWRLVPQSCEDYVGHYMLGKQYRKDCEVVANAAIEYVQSLQLVGDGKDAWVFDIDETTLSNLPYYARSDVQFGAIAYNSTTFDEWTAEGTAPAIPSSLRLYNTLVSLGIKTIFLTGTRERFRDIRTVNLNNAGYYNWERLILRGANDTGSSVLYKSSKRTELVNEGYIILGNYGDQWSDLLGDNAGNRTFKVPDPMYYIG